MDKKVAGIVLIGIAAVAAIAGIVATRPRVEMTDPPASKISVRANPLDAPLLKHMSEAEHLSFGPTTASDVAIIDEGEQVRVVLSPSLLSKLGPGALERLGMMKADESMSTTRYYKLLNELHEFLVERSGTAGEHHHHEDQDEGGNPAAANEASQGK